MKVGLQISRFTWPKEPQSISDTLATIATTADSVGFNSLWVMDHFFQIPHVGMKEEPMLEAYTTLGFLAGKTKKVTLGTMVTGVIYRQPALLVKAVTTLDVLSKGRAILGIGAAWNEEESKGLGFPFPSLKERFEELEETLIIAKQMFQDNTAPISGKHFNLSEPINHPIPLAKPTIPILIGGGGEKKTLRLVAQYANACNLFANDEPGLIHKLQVLQQHCKEIGRNYREIEKTVLVFASPTVNPAEIIGQAQHLRELGIDHAIFGIRNVEAITPLHIFGEKIIPQLAKL